MPHGSPSVESTTGRRMLGAPRKGRVSAAGWEPFRPRNEASCTAIKTASTENWYPSNEESTFCWMRCPMIQEQPFTDLSCHPRSAVWLFCLPKGTTDVSACTFTSTADAHFLQRKIPSDDRCRRSGRTAQRHTTGKRQQPICDHPRL